MLTPTKEKPDLFKARCSDRPALADSLSGPYHMVPVNHILNWTACSVKRYNSIIIVSHETNAAP